LRVPVRFSKARYTVQEKKCYQELYAHFCLRIDECNEYRVMESA